MKDLQVREIGNGFLVQFANYGKDVEEKTEEYFFKSPDGKYGLLSAIKCFLADKEIVLAPKKKIDEVKTETEDSSSEASSS